MPALPIAAPSCVIPASVAENAFFLAHKVQEVGLCFFETKACLAYDNTDLPRELCSLPLRWHVHLPLDLPWAHGAGKVCGKTAAQKALAVFAKAAYLKPHCAVLHPPTFAEKNSQEHLLQDFANTWYKKNSTPLLLENIHQAPLYDLSPSFFEKKSSKALFGICLDIGHMLAFRQEELLKRKDLLKAVAMVHWSAPGETPNEDKHHPLSHLSTAQKDSIKALMPLLPKNCVHMIEVFQWQGIETSMVTLRQFLEHTAW